MDPSSQNPSIALPEDDLSVDDSNASSSFASRARTIPDLSRVGSGDRGRLDTNPSDQQQLDSFEVNERRAMESEDLNDSSVGGIHSDVEDAMGTGESENFKSDIQKSQKVEYTNF